jgi:hypothetical protein
MSIFMFAPMVGKAPLRLLPNAALSGRGEHREHPDRWSVMLGSRQ